MNAVNTNAVNTNAVTTNAVQVPNAVVGGGGHTSGHKGHIVIAVVVIVFVCALIAAGFAIWKWYDPKRNAGTQVPVSKDEVPVNAGPVNAGPVNAGPVNAGPVNTGPVNTGPVNAGPVNAGPVNAGPVKVPKVTKVPVTKGKDPKVPKDPTKGQDPKVPVKNKKRDPKPIDKNIWRGQPMTISTGKKTFMPYVEWNGAKPQNTSSATFAFITSMHGKPGWEAGGSVSDLVKVVKTMKSFRISFGGQGSIELAQAIKDVPTLVKTYQSIITTYGATWLDFDIEEAKALSDTGSIDRRNAALAQLQKSNPGLKIDYTLSSNEPGGLESSSLNLLKNAKSHGVLINCVNPMTFDNGHFSDNAGTIIKTVQNVKKQIDSIGLTGATVGITVMVGKDDGGQMFSLSDASKILAFAKSTSWVSLLSFWSEALDAKMGYAYSKVFSAFNE